ncbi:methylthioribose-1-phosphate isomerase [Thermotomaculum hydrothermale]|uniref:Methylthioribose-1-phosphate isomerase n=1 Tax=Thermotomaculum hydrothermale TaxID=981385 RepID=A0A7R6PLD9_9BACT|nr:S-methyl-5-thioribose-1-phosphate isomerase [Thermotomaculum hydrothermale]BBB32242.1 methylthioribose-1-phosphate isomerase [Thermotomaculum hydrothermale]
MNHIQFENGKLILLDQRKLPFSEEFIVCETAEDVARAIKDMIVRGAPAIGITAAYGFAMGIKEGLDVDDVYSLLLNTRPTAVNLKWALDRMKNFYKKAGNDYFKLLEEVRKIHLEDIEINRKIGENGADLFKSKVSILTHCNAGALATGDYGTALGVIRSLHKRGLIKKVLVDETRPYLQGARLTAYEMVKEGIPHFVITDNTSGLLMSRGEVDAVIVGADRIAKNGDTANKIGTFMLAVLANYFNIPFYIAAPVSTFDFSIESGNEIVIEERGRDEVALINGKSIIPEKSPVLHFGFDITPNELITGFITEKGVVKPPFDLLQKA